VISHLAGTVSTIAPDGAVIEVGGVGLLVQCTPATLATLRTGQRARVATSLVVREDALTLYGFVADDERDVFELLQTASGVGPRLALAMLAVFTPDGLRRAVAAEDVTALTRVPGIGRKGAQRIVLELAGRLGAPGTAAGHGLPGGVESLPGTGPWRDQVWGGRRVRPTRRSPQWRRTWPPMAVRPAGMRPTAMAPWTWPSCCGPRCGS
jgi:Holliday junction DNA helicase RuvA